MTDIKIIRSRRKTIGIVIRPDGQVFVRAPERIPMREIHRMLEEKRTWIEKHRKKVQTAEEGLTLKPLTNADIRGLADKALQ